MMKMQLVEEINNIISLAGKWCFALDAEDRGIEEAWFYKTLSDEIELPGILQAQGYGNEIGIDTPWNQSLYDKLWFRRKDYEKYIQPGNVKVPFLSQPPRHYLGAAWYQRDIEIPEAWLGRRVELKLERTQWKSTLWIEDREIGSRDSLCTSHVYDLGILPPGKCKLTIRLDNRVLMPYRPDAHSISDAVGNSWNGIAGAIELISTTPVWLEDIRVYPNLLSKSALFKINIGNVTGENGKGTLMIGDKDLEVHWDCNGGYIEYELFLGEDVQAWDDFNPSLQHLTIKLKGDGGDHKREITFGLRELKTEGTDFLLNGRKVYFRGTHDGGCFPLTGYPATAVEAWKKIIKICQNWGLNFIRFHSWCPPEAAFTAADELGFYLQPECGMWNCFHTGSEMEKRLHEETERIIKVYGNHPSFMMLAPSNEPSGDWKECLTSWVERWRIEDSRRLYTAESGWAWPEELHKAKSTDYLYMHRSGYGPHGGNLRGKTGWLGKDFREALVGVKVPVVAHELGQWCSYPDYDVMEKFTGYLRPYNYEIFRDSLESHNMLHKNKDFAKASGKLQAEIYKEEIEANLRTPHIQGFELLDLHDYLGQGTALVGLLDAFWGEKGHIKPEKFREFCNNTVPLARLYKRVFTNSEKLQAEIEISHFGGEPLKSVVPYWRITDGNGNEIAVGMFKSCDIPLGKNFILGNIKADLSQICTPMNCTLEVGLQGRDIKNSWNFWVYEEKLNMEVPENIIVTKSLKEAETSLMEGKKVLYLPVLSELNWKCPPLETTPVFWNKQMGPTWGRSLGLWCDVKHEALGCFPTDEHQSWQWIDILQGARGINLENFPKKIQPIVQPIDEWNRNYKLALIFECKVGKGELLVCSADIERNLDERISARQLRYSLLKYMNSESFVPEITVNMETIKTLMFDTLIMKKASVKVKSEAVSERFPLVNAIDGDPNTYWLAGTAADAFKYPYEIEMEFPAPTAVSGIVYMPRQNHREHEGDVREYSIKFSSGEDYWKEIIHGELDSSFEPKEILFPEKIVTSKIKFTALSGFSADDIYYWRFNHEKGWLRQKGLHCDNTVSIGEIAAICPDLDLNEDISIEYKNIKTATAEIDE
jgi:beta-galactosidase